MPPSPPIPAIEARSKSDVRREKNGHAPVIPRFQDTGTETLAIGYNRAAIDDPRSVSRHITIFFRAAGSSLDTRSLPVGTFSSRGLEIASCLSPMAHDLHGNPYILSVVVSVAER